MDTLQNIALQFNIPLVSSINGLGIDIKSILDYTKNLTGVEGFVLRFDNGHMCKIKTEEYVLLHKSKETLQQEKNVWALVLDEKQDDAKAFMEQEDKDRIDAFAADLYGALDATVERLKWEVIAWVDNNGDSQKKFAVEFINGKYSKFDRHEKSLLFKIKNDVDNARKFVYEYVRANLGSSTKVDDVRHLAGGVVWGSY